MTPGGFELTISAGEGLQTHALNRVASGTGNNDSEEYFLLLDSCSYNDHYFYFIPSYRKLSFYVRLSRNASPFHVLFPHFRVSSMFLSFSIRGAIS